MALQVALESAASKQSVNDWNVATLDKHFAKVCWNTPNEYHPFWMHPDIQQHYRIHMRWYDDDKWSFSPGGFRFNPRYGLDDPFGVFVQSLGEYFIVIEKKYCNDAKCDTEAIWKISGQRLGKLWTPTGKERLTASPFGGASRLWMLRLLQELWLQCPSIAIATIATVLLRLLLLPLPLSRMLMLLLLLLHLLLLLLLLLHSHVSEVANSMYDDVTVSSIIKNTPLHQSSHVTGTIPGRAYHCH